MRQLDAGNSPLAMDELCDSFQRLDVLIFPNSKVTRGDAPVCRNRRCLDHRQGDPAGSPTAQMNQMPIVSKSIPGAILAHRRHGDPVAKRDTSNCQWAEQIDLGYFPVVVSAGPTGVCRDIANVGPSMGRSCVHSWPGFPSFQDLAALVQAQGEPNTGCQPVLHKHSSTQELKHSSTPELKTKPRAEAFCIRYSVLEYSSP